MSETPQDQLRPGDDFTLVSAMHWRSGEPIPVWDAGYGQLWTVLDNIGMFVIPIGFVRARTFEEAWDCAIDEIFPAPSDEDIAEHEARCEKYREENLDNPEVPEGWHYRGSGEPSNGNKFPRLKSLYAETSLDIQPLRPTTPEDLVEVHLEWECSE